MTPSTGDLAVTFITMQLLNLGCKNLEVERSKWGRELTIRFKHGKRKWAIGHYDDAHDFEVYRDGTRMKDRKDWSSVIALFKKLWNK